jgi:hypothetical protein
MIMNSQLEFLLNSYLNSPRHHGGVMPLRMGQKSAAAAAAALAIALDVATQQRRGPISTT